jgi:Xaa-Pro aminopeptidase
MPRALRPLAAALLVAMPALALGAQTAGAPATDAPRQRAVPAVRPRAAAAPTPPAASSAALAITREEYAARRAALAAMVPDTNAIIVAFGAGEPRNDYEAYSQAPDFQYLTGFAEPEAGMVLVKRGTALDGTLFVQPSDPTREVWTGRRAGVDGAATASGLAARTAGELRAALDSLAATGLPLVVVGDFPGGEVQTRDEQLVAALRRTRPDLRVVRAGPMVAQLRARKSAAEVARIRRAVDITVAAHRDAMRLVQPGLNEFEVQAAIEYAFRRNGAERPSFATIVGSGPNSTTLHYNANDRPMRDGDVVVMDIGASYAGYAADVTRTLPVNGRFTPAQRAVYQLVRDAQAAAERAATVGAQWTVVNEAARSTIAAGLARLGLIEAPEATYDCGPAPTAGGAPRQCPQVALYFMHGLGHGIGLEVHDPAQFYFAGTIREGDAFTIEPGVYVRSALLSIIPDTPRNAQLKARLAPVLRTYADIGVRIEDDYVVTAGGVEWISRAPRELAEVEAAMREPWRGPAPRDAGLVAGYVPR